MPKYKVDVKAFASVEIEASSAAEARRAADGFIEALSPVQAYIDGYNGETTNRIGNEPYLEVDGSSEVERMCDSCGETTEGLGHSLCWECEPDTEVPLDTPALDTSFHDHEMNV